MNEHKKEPSANEKLVDDLLTRARQLDGATKEAAYSPKPYLERKQKAFDDAKAAVLAAMEQKQQEPVQDKGQRK